MARFLSDGARHTCLRLPPIARFPAVSRVQHTQPCWVELSPPPRGCRCAGGARLRHRWTATSHAVHAILKKDRLRHPAAICTLCAVRARVTSLACTKATTEVVCCIPTGGILFGPGANMEELTNPPFCQCVLVYTPTQRNVVIVWPAVKLPAQWLPSPPPAC